MLTDIIDGLSIQLNSAFGDEYAIYSEDTEQGFQRPCFFIAPLKPSTTRQSPARTAFAFPLDIRYFPADHKAVNEEMYAAADRLFEELELIQASGISVRGSHMHYEIVEGVLHFYVTFRYHQVRRDSEDVMEELAVYSSVVEG